MLSLLPAMLSAQITLSIKDLEIKAVIQQIERTSDYRFFYSSNLTDLNKKVSIEVANASIDKVLQELFAQTAIGYRLSGNSQITLSQQDKPEQKARPALIGTIKGEHGEPLIGVGIIIKGSRTGAVSDMQGRFSFASLPTDAVLVFSCIGYVHTEVAVTGRSTLDVVMKEESQVLDQVVVIGYGTLERRELTSSVTSLKTKDFTAGNVSNPLQAIAGKVSGLSVVSNAGSDPNGGVSLQLRGVNSVMADKGPLIVVDGIPNGNASILQTEDIVSIDVLKDGSAAAIYGTRASGGVILVTTRMGKEGKPVVSYSSEFTTETILRKADVLSADEWVSNGFIDKGAKTDWFDVITRTPFTQRQVLTLSGGTKSFNAYTSAYYKTAQGMTIGSDRKEIGGRFNFSYKTIGDRVEITGRVNYVDICANYTDTGIFRDALALNPTISPYNADDLSGYNILTGNNEYNPLANIMLKKDFSRNSRIQANMSVKVDILKGLNTTMTIGNVSGFGNGAYWESMLHRVSRDNNRKGYASQTWDRYGSDSFEWYANYNRSFGRHSVKAVAGYSFQQYGGKEKFYGSNANFSTDGFLWYNMGSGSYIKEGRGSLTSSKAPRQRLAALFARVNYSFDDRYMLTASIRREGSSMFGVNNRYGYFPSVSAAWRVSSESFMSNIRWIDDLKIRAGYGMTGNAGFDPGTTTRMYKPDTDPFFINNQWLNVYGLSKNVNDDLQWERKNEYNIGLDYDLLDHRLSGKVDFYKRFVNGMLYEASVSQPPYVYPKMQKNVGNLENIGFEAEVTGDIVRKKDFNYTATLRVSHNKTTLASLWGDDTIYDTYSFPAPGSPGTAVRLSSGEELGQFYIWKYAGIDDEGNWLLYDKDNNIIPAATKTQADKRFIGNAIPDFVLSLDNTIRYKNLDLNIFLRSWIGHDIFNMTQMYFGLPNVSNQNMLRAAFKKNAHIKGEKELCDYFIEDGTFLKLDAMSLGYTFAIPAISSYIKNIRISLTGRNLFCLTSYSGLDPETDINGLTPGFEGLKVYPRTRVFTLGINVNF